MLDPNEVCRRLNVHFIKVVASRRGSMLLKVRRDGLYYAVKTCLPDVVDAYNRTELLRHEAMISRSVDPHLSRRLYVASGRDEYIGLWLMTHWIQGITISKYAQEIRGNMSALTLLFEDVTTSLSRVHTLGILHGDVQPAHVLIADNVKPMIIDWGLARYRNESQSYAGALVHYAAPEVAKGMLDKRTEIRYTPASEIYSLGALFRFCLDGKTMVDYAADDNFDIKLKRVIDGRLRKFAQPVSMREKKLQQTIVKCVSKDPHDRFQSLNEIAEALKG